MTIEELRDRLIADGIEEVAAVYGEDSPKRAGAVEGFELCRRLDSREAYERVLNARTSRETRMKAGARRTRHRYATLQVEWILSCLIAAGWRKEGDSISGRAIMKVASIVGVRAE